MVIRSTPSRAQVTVNPGGHTGQADMQLELPPGNYVVVGTLGERYHPVRQEVTVVTDSSRTVNLPLSPAFGDLTVSSTPSGATLFIDGVRVGTTPFTQTEILSGSHQIRLELSEHYTYEAEVEVNDEQRTVESVTMESSKGGLTVTSTPSGGEVWIRGQRVGTTPYRAPSMDPGVYPIRVTMDLHLDDTTELNVTEGSTATFAARLSPNYGSIRVESTPPGASIFFDGESQSEVTPHRFDRQPAGSVRINLALDGHGDWDDTITVTPTETTRVRADMSPMLGRILVTANYPDGSICSDEGAISIDGEAVGTLPYMGRLLAVTHRVEVECRGMRSVQNVTIEHNERLEVPMTVNMFTRADLSSAKGRRTSAMLLDVVGFGGTAALGFMGIQSFIDANAAYTEAASITDPAAASLFDSLNRDGDAAASSAVIYSASASALLTGTLFHWYMSTRHRAATVREIESALDSW